MYVCMYEENSKVNKIHYTYIRSHVLVILESKHLNNSYAINKPLFLFCCLPIIFHERLQRVINCIIFSTLTVGTIPTKTFN